MMLECFRIHFHVKNLLTATEILVRVLLAVSTSVHHILHLTLLVEDVIGSMKLSAHLEMQGYNNEFHQWEGTK